MTDAGTTASEENRETILAVPRALWGVNTPSRMEGSMTIGRVDRQNARR